MEAGPATGFPAVEKNKKKRKIVSYINILIYIFCKKRGMVKLSNGP